jgi:hypothetical protein
MNLLDRHYTGIKKVIQKHGRPVKLITPSGVEYNLTALWNDVDHVLKLEVLTGNPMGARSSIYIDRDSLQLETGEIVPAEGWQAFGSPNSYDPEKNYVISIPKIDHQLPGVLLFISPENVGAESWPDIGAES